MTDTTDIAALREAAKKFATTFAAHRASPRDAQALSEWDEATSTLTAIVGGDENNIIVALFDMLEAERQRAAGSEEELHKALHREKAAERKFLAAQEEIAALNSAHGNMVTRCALLRQRTDLPVDRIPAYNSLVKAQEEVKELREKLANPVVLSDCSFEAVSHMAHWYSEGECVAWVSGAEHVKKQIVAAGFSVREE